MSRRLLNKFPDPEPRALVHTGFHIEVAKGTPIEEADRIAEEVNEKVASKTGCQHCVIHMDLTK